MDFKDLKADVVPMSVRSAGLRNCRPKGRSMVWWILYGVCFVIGWSVLPLWATASISAHAVNARLLSDGFPLWRSVPTSAFAVLGEGKVGGTNWGVYAFRSRPTPKARETPCIEVATITALGEYGHSTECGSLTLSNGSENLPVFTLIGGSRPAARGGHNIGETVIGIAFASTVVKATVEVEPGAPVTLRTKYLSVRQGRKAHLGRFRYLAFSLSRDVCVKHITGVDRQGTAVVDAESYECPIGG